MKIEKEYRNDGRLQRIITSFGIEQAPDYLSYKFRGSSDSSRQEELFLGEEKIYVTLNLSLDNKENRINVTIYWDFNKRQESEILDLTKKAKERLTKLLTQEKIEFQNVSSIIDHKLENSKNHTINELENAIRANGVLINKLYKLLGEKVPPLELDDLIN